MQLKHSQAIKVTIKAASNETARERERASRAPKKRVKTTQILVNSHREIMSIFHKSVSHKQTKFLKMKIKIKFTLVAPQTAGQATR